MNKTIITIMKKELARFFGDKRMTFTTIFLPGLMIFVMYTFMGDAMSSQFSVKDDFVAKVSVANLPESIASGSMVDPAQAEALNFKNIDKEKIEQAKKEVTEQKIDLCIVFPENFDQDVEKYQIKSGEKAPNVDVYYNAVSTESQNAYNIVVQMLDGYEGTLTNKFDFNQTPDEVYDMATKEDTAGSVFSSMLPMLLLIFLFSGCMAVAPESIAGEKERGTIATLLITPAKRGDIAIGKIIALSIIALLSGISSALGTVLSLPKLMGGDESSVNANVYQITDYLLLGLIIMATVLVLVAVISIVSAFAKTTKEAQTYITPLMIVVILVGVTAMFGEGAKQEWYYYLIPIYNSVQCMVGTFSFKAVPLHIVITIVSNLVCTMAGVFVLTRMFNSEKVIFSK